MILVSCTFFRACIFNTSENGEEEDSTQTRYLQILTVLCLDIASEEALENFSNMSLCSEESDLDSNQEQVSSILIVKENVRIRFLVFSLRLLLVIKIEHRLMKIIFNKIIVNNSSSKKT